MVAKLAARHRSRNPLNPNYDWKSVESKARKFSESRQSKAVLQRKLAGKKAVGYVEGPPTLNNVPHIGHVRGRMMKDAWYRYRTQRGERVIFRGGWDTQGLPVELQAEKELGMAGNKRDAVKKIGEERLVQVCKDLVAKYLKSWLEADSLLGLSMDHERSYMTYRDTYIEREWKYLETGWKRGLLGEGYKVVPYCPGCMTSLSHAEAASEYETLEDPSLFYKVRIEDGSYLAVWTTMPFTVVTDEMVGVKPEAEYAFVRVGGETWVVAAERLEGFSREAGVELGEVVKRVKGRELEGLRYQHPLLDLIPGLKEISAQGKIHRVFAEDFVDTTTGTGLVHMAPANGEDDFMVASARNLPVFSPLDEEVRFTKDAGHFGGMFVRDADAVVCELLKERGALVHQGTLMHEYPTCWRSGHRLVWVARREYFYWLDRIGEDLVKAAEGVEYFFDAPKNRFLQFIRESRPWCISRERFWGAPLPIWACTSCGEKVPAFSRKRILELSVELPDGPNFELHRPWIDRVVLKCPKCGGKALREPFVLDTWHNSGASPYAAFTDREHRELVPVAFLTEAMDQTRGWAYTLLVLNVLLTGKPRAPYKAFLFQGFVLDEKGRKMSKSLGNFVRGLDVLHDYSVDLSRLYILGKSSPIDSLSLDLKEMSTRPYQVLNTLYHLHVYLSQNGDVDGYNPARHTLNWARERHLLSQVDRWLLAKLNTTSGEVYEAFDGGRFNDSCKSIEDLAISAVSQNYIRLIRTELWKDDPKGRNRRLAIYAVLGHALLTVDGLLHPVSPFVTEYLYQEVFAHQRWKSPLVANGFPTVAEGRADNAEAIVDFALKVEEACNSARTRAGLKRRWPLRLIRVMVGEGDLSTARHAMPVIKSLCNVKEVAIGSTTKGLCAEVELVPNRARIGAQFKERTGSILKALKPLSGQDAVSAYTSGKPVSVDAAAGHVEVPVGAFELSLEPAEGTMAAEKGGVFVSIDRNRDEKLIAEGLVRDVARRLQALRKEKGFVPTAMLGGAWVAGLEEDEMVQLESLKDEIEFLVRVKEVHLLKDKAASRKWSEGDLDGRPIYLDVG